MKLEDRTADVRVEKVRNKLVEVDDADVDILRLRRLLDAVHKERFEPCKRVLVHRIDHAQIGNAEEEDRATDGDRDVLPVCS